MKVIFGTTSNRKKKDLQNIINQLGLELQVLSMDDIGWNRGDIIEDGSTIAENIIGYLTKPYFYSVFILQGTMVAFNQLKGEELNNTYRYQALKESLHSLVKK